MGRSPVPQPLSREEKARRNRELVPNVAAMLDEVKQLFPNARLVWGKDLETGYEIGRKGAEVLSPKDMEPRKA